MTHKEIATHIRKRVRKAGIAASVRMSGSRVDFPAVIVQPVGYNVRFTADEQFEIATIADVNGLLTAGRKRVDLNEVRRNGSLYAFGGSFYLP